MKSLLTRDQAIKAIYIDFEGFVKEPPALIGVLVEDHFYQILLDSRYAGAADYKDTMPVEEGKVFIERLQRQSIEEDRKIVAFSVLERDQCLRWYGTDISEQYVNAKQVAGRWARKVKPEVRCRTLKDFEMLTGFERSKDTGFKKNTSCLSAALRDLSRYGRLQNIAPKRHWTNLRKHNRQDVEATRHIVLATFAARDLAI